MSAPKPDSRERKKPPKRDWQPVAPFCDLKLSHLVEIGLTMALVFVGVSQLVVYRHQAAIMNDQLNSMRLDQRAWLSFVREARGPLTFDKAGATLGIDFHVRDTGRIPSTNVAPKILLYPVEPDRPIGQAVPRSAFCKGEETVRLHQTIFPGQEKVLPEMVHTEGWSPDDQDQKGAPIAHPSQMVVSGCIRYQSGDDATLHCTGVFGILVPQPPPEAQPFAIDPARKVYSVTEFRLNELPINEYADDCADK